MCWPRQLWLCWMGALIQLEMARELGALELLQVEQVVALGARGAEEAALLLQLLQLQQLLQAAVAQARAVALAQAVAPALAAVQLVEAAAVEAVVEAGAALAALAALLPSTGPCATTLSSTAGSSPWPSLLRWPPGPLQPQLPAQDPQSSLPASTPSCPPLCCALSAGLAQRQRSPCSSRGRGLQTCRSALACPLQARRALAEPKPWRRAGLRQQCAAPSCTSACSRRLSCQECRRAALRSSMRSTVASGPGSTASTA